MDGPHRRARRVPRARPAGLVAALGALLVAVLALPAAHSAFSATSGTPVNSLAADQVRPPSGLAVTQTCSYTPIVVRGALASTGMSPLALSPPAGTQAGDVLVAQVAYYGTSPLTAPGGWTRVVLADTSGGVVTSAVYWKVAAAGEPAASFARPSTESGDMVGGIVAYRGVSASAPVSASGGATGTGDTATSPALTTSATGAVAVHLLARSGGNPPPRRPPGSSGSAAPTARASPRLTSRSPVPVPSRSTPRRRPARRPRGSPRRSSCVPPSSRWARPCPGRRPPAPGPPATRASAWPGGPSRRARPCRPGPPLPPTRAW